MSVPAVKSNIKYLQEPGHKSCDVFNHTGASNGGDEGNTVTEEREKRVERLESDLTAIKAELSALTSGSETFATQSDLEVLQWDLKESVSEVKIEMHKSAGEAKGDFNGQLKWFVWSIFILAALVLAAAKFIF